MRPGAKRLARSEGESLSIEMEMCAVSKSPKESCGLAQAPTTKFLRKHQNFPAVSVFEHAKFRLKFIHELEPISSHVVSRVK